MKKAILLLSIILLTSCSKEEIDTTVGISLNLTYTTGQVIESKPYTAVLTTDKGSYEFDLINISGGEHTSVEQLEKGIHKIYDLSLYDLEGNVTHFVNRGYSEYVTNWVDDFEYDMTEGKVIIFQVTTKQFY